MSPSPPPSSSSSSTSYGATNAPGAENGENGSAPLSTHDRRERNKAASAKYRAKKHHQSGEMRQQITVLQDQNNVLTRQLQESRTENASLKNTIEKLRGRLVAEKVLRRLREVGRERRRGSSTGGSKVSVHDLASGSEDEDDDEDEIDDIEGDEDVRVGRMEDDEDNELLQDAHRPEKRSKPNPRRRSD
jgi:regulator of replication initiation timing